MGNKRRLNLSFSMAQPVQRRAWWILSAIPEGQRTDAICRMVVEHEDRRELLEAVRAAVRDELRGGAVTQINEEIVDTREAGDFVDDDVLGFLRSLQDD